MPGLDEILGGGLPEFSFNIIGGSPGCGKTTMTHQFAFANGTVKKPALYFTILGEPVAKMMRYQQQFAFFDESKLGKAVRFINLSDLVLEKNLDAVLEEIIRQVTSANAGVVVDSFRTLARKAISDEGEVGVNSFIHRLSQFLTSWEATTFLVGEYVEEEIMVIKKRGGQHSKDIREYVITNKGMVLIHPRRTDYIGLITGIPTQSGPRMAQEIEVAPEPKAVK